uniref:Uncharacterized protein n=1 Tax=Amphimedon queenslandica TaxID=400682 RepID=A0A1X7SSP0_AMPQE
MLLHVQCASVIFIGSIVCTCMTIIYMWRFTNSLIDKGVYISRKLLFAGMLLRVSGLWTKGETVKSGVHCVIPLINSVKDLEMAIAYWNLIFTGRFKFLDLWCEFLKSHYKRAGNTQRHLEPSARVF